MAKLAIGFVVLGTLLVALAIAGGWFVIPGVIQTKIVEKVRLVEGTQTWERWSNITTPIFMNIRVFHVHNPAEVAEGKKPILEERGPYVYQEKRVKLDLKLDEEKDTVSYRQPVSYFFRPDLSNGTEEDYVTVLNMPLALLAMKGSGMSFLAQMAIQGVLSDHEEDEKLFSNTTVGELLYGGRYVPMMKTLDEATGTAPLRNYTFGVFFPKNGSDEGRMEVRTGVTDPTDFGKVVSWKGQTKLEFWGGDTCNMINGTDGSLFAPFVERERTVYLFSPDLCRSLYLTYTEDTELKGIKGYRFGVPRAALAGPKENQANDCFCTDPATDYNNCLGAGAIQLSACRNGAPIVMSTPHFFDGEQEYLDAAIGLSPDKEQHQTFIELEPNTGLMLKAHKRIQLNVQISPNTVSDYYGSVPSMLFPILWADEKAEMSDATAEGLKKLVLNKMGMVETGKWILLGVGILVMAVGIILLVVSKNSHDQRTKYSPANTHEKAAQEMNIYEVPLKQ